MTINVLGLYCVVLSYLSLLNLIVLLDLPTDFLFP